MRAPELPGFPDAVLNPLLIIQISCLADNHNPQPVAERLWEHVKDVYGTPAVQPVSAPRLSLNKILMLSEGCICGHSGGPVIQRVRSRLTFGEGGGKNVSATSPHHLRCH